MLIVLKKKLNQKYLVFFVIFIFLVFFVFIVNNKKISAKDYKFFPSDCIGNWKNKELVLSYEADNHDNFNEQNSALLINTEGDLACAGFKTPDEFRKKDVGRIRLNINWLARDLISNIATNTDEFIEQKIEVANFEVLDENKKNKSTSTMEINDVDVNFLLKQDNIDKVDTEINKKDDVSLSSSTEEVITIIDDGSDVNFKKDDDKMVGGINFAIKYSFDGEKWELLEDGEFSVEKNFFFIPLDFYDQLDELKISIEFENNNKAIFIDSIYLDFIPDLRRRSEEGREPSLLLDEIEDDQLVNGYRIIKRVSGGSRELWGYKDKKGEKSWFNIAGGDDMTNDILPVVYMDNIFWLNKNKTVINMLNMQTQGYSSRSYNGGKDNLLEFMGGDGEMMMAQFDELADKFIFKKKDD